MKTIIAALLLLAPSAALAASVAAPLNIGVASAVRGAVRATAPGAAGRVVETGKPVYSRDKVTTGPEGKLQILLLDQTSFTVGPNSELELDEFVFDPATNAGKVSAKIAKGAFRFVTGKIARRDPSTMQVTTPVGTIGIRGTMTAGTVGGGEATIVLLGPGPENNADEKSGGITVKNDKGSTAVDKDGWGVTVKAGEAPSPAFELSPAQLEGILSSVGSAPKGDAKDDSAAGGAAGSSSGQDTAKGKDNAGDVFAALDSSQGDVSEFASQQFGAPTVATWANVIAIPGGTGKYTGSGSYYLCTGGVCGGAAQGTTSFTLDVDFGAKTLGGGSSAITLSGVFNVSSNNQIQSLNYSSLSGDAVTSLTLNGGPSYNWSGTSLKLLNTGGVTAGAASIDVRVQSTTGPPQYGGAVTGSLSTP
ncbi:MAG: FecR domain-containing protein [Elusimicrobiota bacterium]|nr:FecR domain-containing protein [Elusimicrobiota bacterium]